MRGFRKIPKIIRPVGRIGRVMPENPDFGISAIV
jgi:hypothetical protein